MNKTLRSYVILSYSCLYFYHFFGKNQGFFSLKWTEKIYVNMIEIPLGEFFFPNFPYTM